MDVIRTPKEAQDFLLEAAGLKRRELQQSDAHGLLFAMLTECRDYFSERADVKDGDYGAFEANEEMRMMQAIDKVLERVRK